MNEKTLHMIGNAHIDPVWLWRWQEGFQEVLATFRSALEMMDEFPDFIFTDSSAAHYEWVEQGDPELFARIRARVAEGRWVIEGGWWVQPDCNLPCGESFVRQGLVGQRWLKAKFGVTSTAGYNVDSFGHHAMLPQILRKSGMSRYVFMRPMPNEKGLPGRVFWWESDDGSRVLAFRIPYEYCTWPGDLEQHVSRCADEIKAPLTELMCFYGVGNHGGGPTRENIRSIARLREQTSLPNLRHSDPARFFAAVEAAGADLPVVHDELQHHASGCYSAHSGVKYWNRRAEQALLRAESWAVLATIALGQPYPASDLARAWKNVLFNQFHDILAGTSLESAYSDAHAMYGEAIAIADRATHYALQAFSRRIAIPADPATRPFVVFNSHAFASSEPVEVEMGRVGEEAVLTDAAGREVPMQRIKPEAAARGRDRFVFVPDVPAHGYRLYLVRNQDSTSATVSSETAELTCHATYLENEYLAIRIDSQTGCISELTDRRLGVNLLAEDAARAVVIRDTSDTWSHNVFHYQDVVGQFEVDRIELVESGPVRGMIRVTSVYDSSELVQEFILYAGRDRLDVRLSLDWHQTHALLKLVFPVDLVFTRQTYEIPFGTIDRPHDGEEEPGQSWVDYSGTARGVQRRWGISLMNDARYSYSITNRELALTVVRSPIYAHHDPLKPAEDTRYRYLDQGRHDFVYALYPHPASWEDARTVRHAAELNRPPLVVPESFHSGTLATHGSLVETNAKGVEISAIKRAEDGDDLIVRAYETRKERSSGEIRLPVMGVDVPVTFDPCEIKTLRISGDGAVTETDLIEWPISPDDEQREADQ